MKSYARTIGGLTCQLVDTISANTPPELVVVLCHGFGAPGTDLVGIGAELLQLNPQLVGKALFIFPAAPLTLDHLGMFGGRAWWPLDVARMTAAIERGEFRDLRNDVPEGLSEARELLLSLMEEVQGETELPTSKVVLGGFSQGSMLAVDVALRLPKPPGALCIWSGTLLCESIWKELIGAVKGIPVVQSHGRQDPILPFAAAIWLRDMLRNAGADLDFIEFDGVHTIPLEALHRTGALLERLAGV